MHTWPLSLRLTRSGLQASSIPHSPTPFPTQPYTLPHSALHIPLTALHHPLSPTLPHHFLHSPLFVQLPQAAHMHIQRPTHTALPRPIHLCISPRPPRREEQQPGARPPRQKCPLKSPGCCARPVFQGYCFRDTFPGAGPVSHDLGCLCFRGAAGLILPCDGLSPSGLALSVAVWAVWTSEKQLDCDTISHGLSPSGLVLSVTAWAVWASGIQLDWSSPSRPGLSGLKDTLDSSCQSWPGLVL